MRLICSYLDSAHFDDTDVCSDMIVWSIPAFVYCIPRYVSVRYGALYEYINLESPRYIKMARRGLTPALA